MSFLVEESDAPFFIPDILALIDLDEEDWLMKEPTPLVESKSKKRRPDTRKDHDAKPTKGRRAATPRLRNKGKIELLRREIDSLEAELERLQQPKPRAALQAVELKRDHTEAVWKAIALGQSDERARAESHNRGLKRKLSEQQMLTMLLAGVLNEWTSLSIPDTTVSACL